MNSVRNGKDAVPVNTTELYVIEGTSTRNKKPVWRLGDGSVSEVPQSADLQNLHEVEFGGTYLQSCPASGR